MTDPKDAGVDGRAACDSDRGIQEDQRNPIPEHSRQERRRRWPFVLGGVVVAIGVLAAAWDWDWFRPLIARESKAAFTCTPPALASARDVSPALSRSSR
jgi:hypothetical protein